MADFGFPPMNGDAPGDAQSLDASGIGRMNVEAKFFNSHRSGGLSNVAP